ncbi:MAG: hypothetical protein J6B18_00805, partial [Bacteroidaceae bacterium]|nr:hypothetical protein [Bacteroidaceae bacterium]
MAQTEDYRSNGQYSPQSETSRAVVWELRGSPANSMELTQNFSVLLSAILSIKRRFLLHFLKKVHKNVGSRTYQSALALLTSRCYACDI